MRLLLASTAIGTLSALSAPALAAETTISTAVTNPVSTGGNDIHITSTGSVKPSGGAAVTIDSSNTVKNEGTIAIKGANGSTGILANTNLAGDITNSGTITLDEDFTPTDTDTDGDLDGPFAQGSGRFGIHVLGGGLFTGNIANSGTITIEGNQSAGIAVDSTLFGSLSQNGKITVLGDNSFGIHTGAVAGNVVFGSANAIAVQGQNSVGAQIGGDIGGVLIVQGTIASTGYRSTTAPTDVSKLDADDLLQGGSALVVGGSVGGGALIDGTATITTFGAAPAMVIGSATQDINIALVPTTDAGIVIKGAVGGAGVYAGVSGTGLSIGGMGHAVNVTGGLTVTGGVAATSLDTNATGIHIGAGATVPQIHVNGTVTAAGAGTSGSAAQAIVIDAGATVNVIANSGTIAATRSGSSGTAAAIVDHSGTLGLIQNNGQIGITNAADIGDNATAIDVRATATGAVVRQIAAASGGAAPLISGSILFGTGNDTLDIQAGKVIGKVDFGGGADVLSLTGASLFRGTLLNSAGAAVTVGTGSTLDLKNLEAVNLASLTTAAGGQLGVTIGEDGHTLYNISGAAAFGTGTKILVTLDHVGTASGTYTIIDAETLTGFENLTSSIVTLPFLFTSTLTADAANAAVKLNVHLKGSGELGLNRSEAAILGAALDAADADNAIAAVFLAAGDSGTIKSTLQQLMPDHAGGAFEAATKGTRLSGDFLADPTPLNNLWIQQVVWGSSKAIRDTASYNIGGWGFTGGYDLPIGKVGSVGLSATWLTASDEKGGTELFSNHYEGGVYFRGGTGPLRLWGRATAGRVNFDSTRNFASTVGGTIINRTSKGKWNGDLYSGSAGIAYDMRMGRFSLRPHASIEYLKLTEKGYTETGGGGAFDLTVRKRSSDETAANALLAVGYDFSGDPEAGMMRFELEGGRREILSGKLGSTTASFGTGDPFTLDPEQRTSGWRGAARFIAGGSPVSVAVEGSAEEQQSKLSMGGRVSVSFQF
ncbi:autotransporter outer membrane beta-barrel domain-containing protein [Sphingomonas sp. URHD0057]|uniref:autotransporter outer membrane beta-barrel domain-containing protein n=1 Tax=Sphingomonas sp. URHD0057 TaxID=1380389 RepID=UPI000490D0EB|nr:autotransporter domain-containing protein [Sphingomonas sp. URHD0057]